MYEPGWQTGIVMKKVLIITPWYPTSVSPVGGIFIQDQVLALSRKYDVYVLALVLIDWKKIFFRLDKTENQLPDHTNVQLKIKEFYTLPGVRFFYSLYLFFYQMQLEKNFNEIVSSWGMPDIIHVHVVLPTGWVALKIGNTYKIPVVLTEHTEPFSLHLRTSVYQRLTRQTLLGVNRIIAVSPFLKKQILEFEPHANIEVIGNVIDDSFFSPASFVREKTDVFHFLTVALLVERKGIRYLIEAVKLLSQNIDDKFVVVIGGDGPLRLGLENLVKQLGVIDNCRFVGALNRSEVRDWINQSDVFVLPSLGETFGVVLLEAMMCGKPVIATRCGGPDFLVTPEVGVLVDVADSVALAGAMNDFIRNRRKFNARSIRKITVDMYGQISFLRRIARVYDDL